ncbi:NAD(P)/FAD-dependent oxidoreductase [bacterium]
MRIANYDIAVIGGGASGMIAAGYAALNGKKVVLIEQNEKLGKKLLITGKGRCNITNAALTSKDLVNVFGKNGKFLYSSFNEFDVEMTIGFFNELGLATKVERGNRVFPVSDKAVDVVKVLESFLKKNNVKIIFNECAAKVEHVNNHVQKIITDRYEVNAEKYIIATGGLSYKSTGSKGDGFRWAKKMGHTVIPTKPVLTPLILKEIWIKQLEGLSLKNVQITAFANNKKIEERFGEALFTSNGISGPIILDMSTKVKEGNILSIDFKPALTDDMLDKRIQRDFKENINRVFKNSLSKLLPKKLIPVIIEQSHIDPDKKVNSITKDERMRLVELVKHFKVNVTGTIGYEKAVVTSGGIKLSEIDPKTMKSKLIDNLYFTGEVLDIDGPTGGYNLQIAWTTGHAAGAGVY